MSAVLRPFYAALILMILALDMSLPSMPGVFVFDADEVVESTHGTNPRVSVVLAAVPSVQPAAPWVSVSSPTKARGFRPNPERALRALPIASMPRACLASAGPTEQPD